VREDQAIPVYEEYLGASDNSADAIATVKYEIDALANAWGDKMKLQGQ
jgi:hypothetical protein